MTRKTEEKQTTDFSRNLSDTTSDRVQDEGASEARERADFYGPVFLTSYEADGQGSYFWVDKPEKLPENAVAVRVPTDKPSLLSILSTAFNGGKPVMVAPGHRWWLSGGKLAWTIWAAKIQSS